MQPATAGRVMKASADELVEVDIEGQRAWLLTQDLPALRRARRGPRARLPPAFDDYVAGTRPYDSLVEPRDKNLVFRKAGWISAVVLVEGLAAGVWRHERAGGRLQVTVQQFRRLSADHRRTIIEEAEGLGKFLDAPTTVAFANRAG